MLLPLLVAASGCIGLPKIPTSAFREPELEAADSLARASESLERGDADAAIGHLADYVERFPDHVAIRQLLAEQRVKRGQVVEARVEYERVLESYRADESANREEMIQTHTRLMQLAQDHGDEFGEAFHRGAGLLLVVQSWDGTKPDRVLLDRTLSQAMGNLRKAVECRPKDAQAQLALGEVYSRMGQHSNAERVRRTAFPSTATRQSCEVSP